MSTRRGLHLPFFFLHAAAQRVDFGELKLCGAVTWDLLSFPPSAYISAELQVFNPSEPIRVGPDSPGNPNLQQRSGLPAKAIISLLLSTSLCSQATVFHFPHQGRVRTFHSEALGAEHCEITRERVRACGLKHSLNISQNKNFFFICSTGYLEGLTLYLGRGCTVCLNTATTSPSCPVSSTGVVVGWGLAFTYAVTRDSRLSGALTGSWVRQTEQVKTHQWLICQVRLWSNDLWLLMLFTQ